MQEPNLELTTEVLKKVLQDKKENLIKLQFDLYVRKLKFKEPEKKIEEIDNKVKELSQIITIERSKIAKQRDKKLVVETEAKVKELLDAKEDYLEILKELQSISKTVISAHDFLAHLEDCSKNPEKIYN